jgi:hypothetical protein
MKMIYRKFPKTTSLPVSEVAIGKTNGVIRKKYWTIRVLSRYQIISTSS